MGFEVIRMIKQIEKDMIDYSNGNKKDIAHFIKVHSYASLIGKLEGLDENRQEILEITAIVHDIACPLCREKYGNSAGPLQEKEGMVLVREFLKPYSLSQDVIDRVAYLVGHHHTYTNVDGLDYQILLEADYLVNADEMNHSKEQIKKMGDTVFKTSTGKALLESIYLR